jgi:hypothetical protein
MPYVVNFLRAYGIQKIYFNAVETPVSVPTDIWAATWLRTDYDQSFPATLEVETNYGNVNKFTYVKPLIPVLDCIGDGGYENSTATEFINGTNCGTPNNRLNAIIDKLKDLPQGKRAYVMTRYNQGPIYNEVADRFANGEQSPWAEFAGTTLDNDITTLFTRIGASGAIPDYISLDMEQNNFVFQYTALTNNHSGITLDIQTVFGITSDAKYNQTWYGLTSFANLYKNTITGQTFGFDNIINGVFHPQTTRDYLYWDRAVSGLFDTLQNKFIVEPLKEIFPNTKISNYDSFVISDGGTAGNYYNYNGHPEISSSTVGDGISPVLYAGWNFPGVYGIYNDDTTKIVRTDYAGTTAFASNAWNHFLLLIQNMRVAKRDNPNTPIRPWIGSPYFAEPAIGLDAKWTDSTENLGLYHESIRHLALHDTEMFYYFNGGNPVAEDTQLKMQTALTRVNSVLQEINTIKGGYQPNKCVTTDRIDFLTEYVLSGAGTTKGTYLWRVTPKPGILLERLDGTVIDLDSDGGAWVETETSSAPTFYNTLNAPYEIVFKYLMNKYEPEWGTNSSTEGKTARANALGVSASYNPFGTTGGTAYQYIAYAGTPGVSAGYFDPLSHPRLYAKNIEGSGYRRLGRARGHTAAKHRFVDDWQLPGVIGDVYYDRGAQQNTFYGFAPRYTLYPQSGGETTDNLDNFRKENTKTLHFNFQLNLDNKIERYYIHSPYGKMTAGMAHDSYLIDSGFESRVNAGERITLPGSLRVMPWISNRYTAESFLWDMYLYCQEETCLRDFTLNPFDTRTETSNTDALNAPFVGDPQNLSFNDYSGSPFTYDIHLNTQYSGMTFPAGQFPVSLRYSSQQYRIGGFTQDVNVGPPWIKFTGGFYWDTSTGETQFEWFGSAPLGLCFNKRTLIMLDGSTWGITPPTLDTNFKPLKDIGYNNFFADYGPSSLVGLSFGYGKRLIESWDKISQVWGNQVEFLGYFGTLPYGQGAVECFVPYMMYLDPTDQSNVDYVKWRLDAAISHWKKRFKSPIDGFARVLFENGGSQRTYHVYEAPGYTKYVNTLPSGLSFVDNIIVSWSRDQYNYTFGPSGPNPNKGVILGTETFAQYNFKWDGWVVDPNNTEFTRFKGDQTPPSHWALDEDIAHDLYSSVYNIVLGQRKYGFTYTDALFKPGVCGSSKLGEVYAFERPYAQITTSLDAYPYFHNTFIEYVGGPITSALKWKRVPGTWFGTQTPDGVPGGVPWIYDRRFRLFFLYPLALYLNMTIMDPMHSGNGYYNMTLTPRPLSGWYDKTLGNTYLVNIDYAFDNSHTSNPVVSNIPYPNRRNPSTPPQNNWNPADIDNSEFELLYSCMKGGLTGELDSLGYSDIYTELQSRGSTGFPKSLFV